MLRVTIDTGFGAIDGARLAEPFTFSFRVPGPRLLRHVEWSFGAAPNVPGHGQVSLVFSAPLPDSSIDKLVAWLARRPARMQGERPAARDRATEDRRDDAVGRSRGACHPK